MQTVWNFVWAPGVMQMELPLEELPLGWHQAPGLGLSIFANATRLDAHVLCNGAIVKGTRMLENWSQHERMGLVRP